MRAVKVDVTVIATFRNDAQYVARTVDALVHQTAPPSQILLVDDGSTDATLSLLNRAARDYPRIEVIAFPKNLGVAQARNYALTRARGDYVWFVDSDDAWSLSLLERMVAEVRRTQADIIVCGAVYTHAVGKPGESLDKVDGDPIAGHAAVVDAVLTRRLRGYLWNKLFRRELLGSDPFPLQRSLSDFVGLTRIVAIGPRVAFVNEVLYWHLRRPGSITNSIGPRIEDFHASWTAGRTLGERTGVDPALLIYFDYWAHHLSIINTQLRLAPSAHDARDVIRRIRAKMRFRDLASVARHSPRLAANSLAVMIFSSSYGRLYEIIRRLRVSRTKGRAIA